MTTSDEYTPIVLPARAIPPPATVSPEARRSLSTMASQPGLAWPDPSDLDGWRGLVAQVTATRAPAFAKMLEDAQAECQDIELGGVRCFDCRPVDASAEGLPVYLLMHGGAFVTGGGLAAKAQGARAAEVLGVRCVSVDYRMPPDHPFPAAPRDCVSVYAALLDSGVAPERMVIAGVSAGGNLAAACLLLCRERGLPMPAGLVLMTPEVDLTESGDSFRTNELLDVVLKRSVMPANLLYAGGADLADPLLSPLKADLSGFPPTFVQSGTRDLFLSNSVLMHRKLRAAGVAAELHVWEAMPHGGFPPGDAPENAEVQAEIAHFVARVTG